MINILLSGCNGKMGQVITKMAEQSFDLKIVAGYDLRDTISNSYPVFSDFKNCNVNFDVIIDFSHPSAFEGLINFALQKNKPIVMATTGLSSSQIANLSAVAKDIPVFFTANMSLGVNLLLDLVKKATSILSHDFDIEIVEKHHNQKVDAPSGTALTIANSINSVLDEKHEYVFDRHLKSEKRTKKEIGIHAVRGGTIVGEHSVIFAGNDEIIEINHMAMSKNIFSTGALNAARFLFDKAPGMYGMSDLISQ